MRPEDVPAGVLAIDTDAFSFVHYRKGDWQTFEELLRGHHLAMPFPVVGELLVGAQRGQFGQRRLGELEAAMRRCTVLPSNRAVVESWALLHARLLGQLKPNGINDLWIAACCLAYELPLVTNNRTDFERIQREAPGLRLVHPAL